MITELSERTRQQLLFSYEQLRQYRRAVLRKEPLPEAHPAVAIGRFRKSSLFFCRTEVEGLGKVLLVEQNVNRSSVFADAVLAKLVAISWVMYDEKRPERDDYTGWLVGQTQAEPQPALYTGEQMREYLNPLLGLKVSDDARTSR